MIRATILAITIAATVLTAGCDFYDEPPPLEGAYEATGYTVALGDSTINLRASGAAIEMQFEQNGSQRRVDVDVFVPAGAVFPNQDAIDTTFTGNYFMIVNSVTLDLDAEVAPLPAAWTYEGGALTASGMVRGLVGFPLYTEIELARK